METSTYIGPSELFEATIRRLLPNASWKRGKTQATECRRNKMPCKGMMLMESYSYLMNEPVMITSVHTELISMVLGLSVSLE